MKDVSDIKSDSEMPDESKNNTEADADEQDQSDVVTEEMPTEEKPAREKPRGRGVAWFALLVALIALGGGGYLYYEVVYKQPMVQLEARLSAGNNLQQQELKLRKSCRTG